ncbi:MAG: hypothetical protein K2X93_08015 [Candidatus Obscuribacterales bacterium]|nr:hypothetical protein [Candidatus Obscuribacterales bacterium]
MVAKNLLCLSICLAALGSPCHAFPSPGEILALSKEQSGPPLLRQTKKLNTSASVEDIVSNTGSSMFFNSGEKTVRGFILGNELHTIRSQGSAPASAVDTKLWKSWCSGVSAKIWALFGKQSEEIGQANLTLVVNADGSWDVLSKTIYVPERIFMSMNSGQNIHCVSSDSFDLVITRAEVMILRAKRWCFRSGLS